MRCLIIMLGLMLAGCGQETLGSVRAGAWASPNLLIDRAGLDAVKQAAAQGKEPVKAARDDLVRTADALLDSVPNPIEGELKIPGYYTAERETQQRITRQLREDARRTHALALAHALTGRAEYGEKARQYLLAWMRSLTRPVDGGHWWQPIERRGDTPLVITYSFPSFIYAFDLLKGAGVLSVEEIAEFRQWLRVFVAYRLGEVFYKNNHHNWQAVFLMCAAHALEDEDLFQRAVRYYRHGIANQIGANGALPRELRRGEKSGTYTLMALEAMVQAAHIAGRHGYELRDLASKRGGTLKDAVAFYLDYLDDPNGWARHTNAKQLNAPKDVSDWGYMLELPYQWWGEPRYLGHMQKRPYGFNVERCYTMDFATLLFAEP